MRRSLNKSFITLKKIENHPTEQDPAARRAFSDVMNPPHLGGQFTCRQFVDESHMDL
jgi:hypothetical protein